MPLVGPGHSTPAAPNGCNRSVTSAGGTVAVAGTMVGRHIAGTTQEIATTPTASSHCKPDGTESKPIASHNHGDRRDRSDGTATSNPWPKRDGEATMLAVPKRSSDSRPRATNAATIATTASAM